MQIKGVADPPSVRLFDPSQLDDEKGSRARLSVTIPDAELRRGCALCIVAPVRLECARCDGGGCDGCHRSGVVRAPAGEGDRTVRVRVVSAGGESVRVRVPLPFRGETEIRQLFVDVSGGGETSACVRSIEPDPHRNGVTSSRVRSAVIAAVVTIASVAAIAGAWSNGFHF